MTDQTTHHAEAILRAAGGSISLECYPSHQREAILAAVREAMEAERKAVMDWLRDEGALQIDSGYDAGIYGGQGMIFAAHEIARGVHLSKPPRGE